MIKYSAFQKGGNSRITAVLERVLYDMSAYAVPVIIGLLSIMALFFWSNHYSYESGSPVEFRSYQQKEAQLTPEEALKRVADQPLIQHFETRRSEAPVWFTFPVQPYPDYSTVSVEFPSRYANTVACWDARTLTPLGSASRGHVNSGDMFAVRAGFTLELGELMQTRELLCRSVLSGPARLGVTQWSSEPLKMAAREFERNAGLLDGGLIVLGIFVLITALINRESTYLLFSAWLLINLRMGALSAGWDVQWLGHTVPPEWMLRIRAFTLTLYYTLTVTLFSSLLRAEIAKVGYNVLLRIAQFTCLPLLFLASFLPYANILPFIWVATGYTTLVLIFLCIRILIKTRTPVAMWYSASLAVTLGASLYEVISAALGMRTLIGSVNFVTNALLSSLLAALAIAAQLRAKHEQWLEAQAELQHTYDAMPIGLFTLDPDGHFLSSNPALVAMLDVQEIQPGEDNWAKLFGEQSWKQLHHMVQTETEGEMEIHCPSKDENDLAGQRFQVKATLARGKIEGTLQDTTARAKAIAELHFMANNDPLTKVLNRRGIDTALEEALETLSDGGQLALAYLDLDRFKLINDLYGHPAGDEILKQVCERITGMLSGSQKIGRVGGDEFVIILPDTPIALASWVCRGIVDCISMAPYHIGDKAFQVRGSIGLIEVGHGTKIKDAVSTADRACRAAKAGNDGLVVYEKDATAFHEREAELKLVERLTNGKAPEGLFLEMQPIMSLKNPHASLNFEVLLRMCDHDGTIISAGRVIPAAESSGRVGVIDRWVLATTLAWLNTHYTKLDRTQFVCMNLSGASLNDERFVQDAFDTLDKNRHVAHMLCLEVTESVALHDLDNTRRFIDKVRTYGVKIALDDFGAGYTSFSYLKDLPADVLKIDGNFIVNMNSHPANVAIVEAIVSLAMNLGMKTIAEWAEDNATVQTLVEIGVDYVQGFAVARPQSPENILSAASSASFIKDRDLQNYVSTLTISTELPPPPPSGITLISSDGVLVSK